MDICILDEVYEIGFIAIDDRSEDRTKKIAESTGAKIKNKNFRGDYVSTISEAVAFGVDNAEVCMILKRDADVHTIPKNALKKLYSILSDDTQCALEDDYSSCPKCFKEKLENIQTVK